MRWRRRLPSGGAPLRRGLRTASRRPPETGVSVLARRPSRSWTWRSGAASRSLRRARSSGSWRRTRHGARAARGSWHRGGSSRRGGSAPRRASPRSTATPSGRCARSWRCWGTRSSPCSTRGATRRCERRCPSGTAAATAPHGSGSRRTGRWGTLAPCRPSSPPSLPGTRLARSPRRRCRSRGAGAPGHLVPCSCPPKDKIRATGSTWALTGLPPPARWAGLAEWAMPCVRWPIAWTAAASPASGSCLRWRHGSRRSSRACRPP
mmetsp:Transcript_106770/g.319188  ORF Transcript_106770/g.319188 Transcript_106770/m.319188 type:complete len:264 (-) Transcript_106770:774-1565(-)